ncbi:MAG: hypothetical protein WBA76_17030 [Phormidesmis sp.]
MVFATEFDPTDQSARTRTLPPRSIHASSTEPSRPAASNVVPLQSPLRSVEPAVRVRINSDRPSLSLPRQPKLPLGLQLLNRLQQGSAIVTSLLVAGALVVYGSTVYVDRSTQRALIQLDTLQGESQQLTAANESIKESLAEQATQPDSGLEPYEAGDMLFLAPASPRKGSEPTAEPMTEMPGPLGY